MAQNLDPNSEGRGVLQFKTGLMSVIKVFLYILNIVESLMLEIAFVACWFFFVVLKFSSRSKIRVNTIFCFGIVWLWEGDHSCVKYYLYVG